MIVALIGLEWSGPAAAGAAEPASAPPAVAAHASPADEAAPRLVLDYDTLAARMSSSPFEQETFAQRRFWGRGRRNDAARTALVLGTLATIAGAAVLVYANRPDCGANPQPGGCSYGTKVVGGSMVAAGVFGIAVGAITWR